MKLLCAFLLTTMVAADISSDSVLGQKLLSKARSVNSDGRALENNNYYTSWMTSYSLKFDGCHSVPQFERDQGMRSMLLAKFKMCPSDNCGKCPNAGEYIVEMRDFIEAYNEAQQSMNEYACETQKETCQYQCENGLYEYEDQYGNQYGNNNYNQNGNNQNGNNQNGNNNNNNNNNGEDNDYCYYQCMEDAGLSYCDNDNNGDNGDMNMDELMECRALGGDDNNQNNNQYYAANSNYQQYYVGAWCDGNKGVYLGTFTDSACSKFAPKGTYEKYVGYSLPTVNLVGTDCISCKAPEENNGNNQNNNNQNQNNNNNNYNYQQDEVFDVCQELYQDAGKCEKNLDTEYKNNGACDLIHGTLKRLDSAYHGGRGPAFGLAWFFGLSCCVLGAYVVWLHTKVLSRQKINLLPSLNGTTS